MNNGKVLRVLFLVLFCFTLYCSSAFASSSYVLPYPSVMPGSKFYKLRVVFELIEKYWYFGNLSQFKYNLSLSDRYLVEAKTLFEYNQFLLADNALKKSDKYFVNASLSINKAENNDENVNDIKKIFVSASQKHREVLSALENELPDVYNWTPEKGNASKLEIRDDIQKSIKIRQR